MWRRRYKKRTNITKSPIGSIKPFRVQRSRDADGRKVHVKRRCWTVNWSARSVKGTRRNDRTYAKLTKKRVIFPLFRRVQQYLRSFRRAFGTNERNNTFKHFTFGNGFGIGLSVAGVRPMKHETRVNLRLPSVRPHAQKCLKRTRLFVRFSPLHQV